CRISAGRAKRTTHRGRHGEQGDREEAKDRAHCSTLRPECERRRRRHEGIDLFVATTIWRHHRISRDRLTNADCAPNRSVCFAATTAAHPLPPHRTTIITCTGVYTVWTA